MWLYPDRYDVIVIGAGHAGCEAAHAASKMGAKTLLLTMNLDTIGKMSCNPSIGGTAKGHLVREIDALGGLMGKIADRSGIMFRLLNRSKGAAVRSPRCQSDKIAYQTQMKHALEKIPCLDIRQGSVESFLVENDKACGVITKEGIKYLGKTLILATGTFMRGLIHIGQDNLKGGRGGENASQGLSQNLLDLGFTLKRLKTGTPPRINKNNIDFSVMEEQKGEEEVCFSFDEKEKRLEQISCYITYTTEKTHEIIRSQLHLSPMYSGNIQGIGPRYCPSIEDKVVRFADKSRHQIFVEPEGLHTDELYINGISTALPFEVQLQMLSTIPGLEKCSIMRPAYAIEYDYAPSTQILPSMETKKIKGLFFAGQINGTTGYEEAGGQGLVAGINAALHVQDKKPFIPSRSESYIGVMVDDLTTMEITEPYRVFTSRAEQRLLLRQDNADLRLREYGYKLGLISKEQYNTLQEQKKIIETELKRFTKESLVYQGKRTTLAQLLSRPECSYETLLSLSDQITDHGKKINAHIEYELKYAGYIQREKKEAERIKDLENLPIDQELDYYALAGLKQEAKEKLFLHKPTTVASASRIYGVTPADISYLLAVLTRRKKR